MKILEINAAYHHGGASIHAMDTCKGLSTLGHDVVFFSIGNKEECFDQDGYRVQILEQKTKTPLYHYINPYILYKLKDIFKIHKPDVLHFHNINLQSFSLTALLFSKWYPLVWTLHDVWPICMIGWPEPNICENYKHQCFDCPNWPQPLVTMNRFLKEAVYKYNDFAITCPSQWMFKNLQLSKLSNKLIEIIPLAIDPVSFKAVKRVDILKELSLPEEKKIILFCGGKRLVGNVPAWRKGWKYFCNALKLLGDLKKQIHLLYVGDELEISKDIGITTTFAKNVSRNEMFSYYKAANLFVLPSMADNSPLTILEAMFCKTPIIASNVGGIPEMVDHGQTGLLCHQRDSIELAKAIEYMITQPDKAKKMAAAGKKKSIKYHNYNLMIKRYEALFKKII